jgi:hypothetical protein
LGTVHQECLVSKAVLFGHACGLWAEEILTCQNPPEVAVWERAPDGAPGYCVLIEEVVVQRRALEEVLDSGFGEQEEDCPLGHPLPAALRILLPPLIW